MQFYRGMDIGTAKITDAERRGVPHHLLDILDVTEEASVVRLPAAGPRADRRHPRPRQTGDPRRRFRTVRPSRPGRAGIPRHGPWPSAAGSRRNSEPRTRAAAQRLEAVDPVSAGRLGDARRIIRALEVTELTGRPFSSFMPTREIRPASRPDRPRGGPRPAQGAACPPRPCDGGKGTPRRSAAA